MDNEEPHEKVLTEGARAGSTPHIARYILLFSTAAVVVAYIVMLVIWG